MTSTMLITLIVTAIMAFLFLWGKFPFGLCTMSCMVVLVLTGVLTVPEGFAGLSNMSVVLVGSMFALSAALQKTNLLYNAKVFLNKLNIKNDMILVFALLIIFLVLEIVMPGMVCMVLIASFLQVLPNESEVTPSRIILPMLMMNVCWEMAVPVGVGATMDFQANAYMEGIVAPEHMLALGNLFSVRIVPTIITFLYILFIWKRMPKRPLSQGNLAAQEIKKSELKPWQQIQIYVMFIAVIMTMLFSNFFGGLMWILPAACVCVLGFTKTMSTKEIVSSVANNTVWMLVGIMAVTSALSKSGAADLVGNALLPMISWTNNSYLILVTITAFTVLMTTFLSNTGTIAVLTPLVASAAVAAGMDPRAMVCCVAVGGTYAFCFPSGSTTCAFAYALGEYNPFKVMKYTLPLLILLVLVTPLCANFIFPLY